MVKLLDGILTEDHRKAGFYIKEADDKFIHLMRNGVSCGVFPPFVTAGKLNDAAIVIMREILNGRQG